MKYFLKIVKSYGDSGILLKIVSEIIKNEAKEQKGRFLLGILDSGILLKIVEDSEDSGILLKIVSETIKNEAIEQKGGFLLGILGTSLLGNLLADKRVIRAGEGTARVGYRSKRFSFKKF